MEIHDEKMAGTQTLQTQDHLLAGGHLVFLSRSTVSGSGNYRRKDLACYLILCVLWVAAALRELYYCKKDFCSGP